MSPPRRGGTVAPLQDEERINEILTQRNAEQMEEIKRQYQKLGSDAVTNAETLWDAICGDTVSTGRSLAQAAAVLWFRLRVCAPSVRLSRNRRSP